MTKYCYSMSVEGDEIPMLSSSQTTDQDAVDHARAQLLDLLRVEQPQSAYCVVYSSLGVDAESLGVWDYSREKPRPRWTPAEV